MKCVDKIVGYSFNQVATNGRNLEGLCIILNIEMRKIKTDVNTKKKFIERNNPEVKETTKS